jgi:hypothetical protein
MRNLTVRPILAPCLLPAQGRGAAPAMGGYQQLVRGEPFRGKFRKNFEKQIILRIEP